MRVQKAIEISDAKISFVSLVDKAANKKQFLITKAEEGKAHFSTYGRIVKVAEDTHYITGIVYAPLEEDYHGNYMTEEEIQKAAYWYIKNGVGIDTQHTFQVADGATVVESYIAPCDMEVNGETIVKGTWMLTAEITDAEIWESVQKGEITGFSMGGVGSYSEEDVDLADIAKNTGAEDPEMKPEEKEGLLRKLAKALNIGTVEKGAMMDAYTKKQKSSGFWNAFYTLEDVLYSYNRSTDKWEMEADESTIREALADFSEIITGLLMERSITKSVMESCPILKIEATEENKQRFEEVRKLMAEIRADQGAAAPVEKEEATLNKEELKEMVADALKEVVKEMGQTEPAAAEEGTEGTGTDPQEDAITKEAVAEIVRDEVQKALDPVLKARGLPRNLNDSIVQKADADDDEFAGVFI